MAFKCHGKSANCFDKCHKRREDSAGTVCQKHRFETLVFGRKIPNRSRYDIVPISIVEISYFVCSNCADSITLIDVLLDGDDVY